MKDTDSLKALARVLQDRKPDLIITVCPTLLLLKEVAWLCHQRINVVVLIIMTCRFGYLSVPVTDQNLLRIVLPENLQIAGVFS